MPLVSLPNDDRTGDFRQHAVVLRRAGFEQLGHARQTAGDVAGLLRLRSGYVPALHPDRRLLAVLTMISAPTWKPIVTDVFGAGDLDFLALLRPAA